MIARMSFEGAQISCCCDAAKLHIVHLYLKQQFPQSGLRHFHAPTRLSQAGLPMPHEEHHVVSIECIGMLPYYAVLLSEFFQCSLEEVAAHLPRWRLADVLRANRIAIVSKQGASAL